MKIKVLHYVFGPCMKGYDITARQVVAQMGQKTIGLSEELLSFPEVIDKLEELAFGDSIEPNAPFEKIYFTQLPGNKYVTGRGVRGMDSAGRGAYFFHHLVIEEAEFLKLKANPMALFRSSRFFDKETDLPDNRLIPPTEIEISEKDIDFPIVDALNKPGIENLLADIFAGKPGQPVWVILERGQERDFIEKLFGIIPLDRRKEMAFSTDFYNSYNIQHYFRLVFVNSEEEIPYKNCTIYNFAGRVFPGKPAAKDTYLKTISELNPIEIKPLVNDISELQVHSRNIDRLSHCRDILRANLKRRKQNLVVFYEVTATETAFVLLGGSDPGIEPDYPLFCDFYGNFVGRIDPGWFITLYSPVPTKIFLALFRLVESHKRNTSFKYYNVFTSLYSYLESSGNGEILNPLAAQSPTLFQEMIYYFKLDIRKLFYLVCLPNLEKDMRIRLTRMLYRDMLKNKNRKYIDQLPLIIKSLDSLDIDTQALKIIVELNDIRKKRDFSEKGLRQYTVSEKEYRELIEIGMHIVNDNYVSLKKMCNYLYVSEYRKAFVEEWLEFIREPEAVIIKPIKLLIYIEAKDWIDADTRGLIFNYLEKGILKLSYIRKYREFLEKKGKDLPEYRFLWEEIEAVAPRGFMDSLVEKIKSFTRKNDE